MQPWSLWVGMSIDRDHRGNLPESFGHRVQSMLTDATGWFSAALSGDHAGRDEDGDPGDGETTGRRLARTGDRGTERPGEPVDDGAEEIVTPEERVVRLVTENGGSMKQGDVVSAVEWSESTVSRKLSKLESEGVVTRYQIGREKLVFLPGQEPESLGSPWREVAADTSGRA